MADARRLMKQGSILLCSTFSQTSSLQNCETINLCCFNHPVLGTGLWQSPRKPIQMAYLQILYCNYVVLSLSHVWLFCDPVDCSPTGSSVQGILQARILEWVATAFSRGASQLRDRTCVSCWEAQILYICSYILIWYNEVGQ